MTIAFNLHAFAQISAERMLNCVAEGLAIALCAWILLCLIGRRNSGTRFAVWFCALLAIAVSPFLEIGSPSRAALIHSRSAAITMPGSWASYLFGVWALIALLGLLRVAAGLWHLRTIRRCGGWKADWRSSVRWLATTSCWHKRQTHAPMRNVWSRWRRRISCGAESSWRRRRSDACDRHRSASCGFWTRAARPRSRSGSRLPGWWERFRSPVWFPRRTHRSSWHSWTQFQGWLLRHRPESRRLPRLRRVHGPGQQPWFRLRTWSILRAPGPF